MCLSKLPRSAGPALAYPSGNNFFQRMLKQQRAAHSRTTRGSGPKQRRPGSSGLSNSGFTLLGPVLLLAISFIGAGLIKVRRAIEHRTQRQVVLDRKTGEFALLLRAELISLQGSYQRLDHYRTITLSLCPATPACPEALEAFKTAAATERLIQESIQLFWNHQRLQFLSDYPEFNFHIASGGLGDLLVSWKTEFESKLNPDYHLDQWDGGLRSQSTVRRIHHGWSVAWTK